MVFIAALICGFLVFLMFVLFIGYTRQSRSLINQRMRYYAEGAAGSGIGTRGSSGKQLSEHFMDFVKSVAGYFQRVRRAGDLDLKMQQAGLPLLGYEYLIIAIIGAVLAGVAAMMMTLKFSVAITVALATILGEWFYVKYRINKRRAAFVNQLGDCLITVANALRAGFSFLQAMELVAREMEPPISEEFERATREMNLGGRMENVMEDMDLRVDSPEFSLVITAVLIHRQVGGNLAHILDTISETINERIRMRREVLSLTAQGRASGWVLALLPVGLAAVLGIINPSYLTPLIEEPVGRIAIAGAVVLEIIGFIVIKRIVDIEV